jgi:hypothetical protein
MMFIDSQILLPELVPEFWIEDLLNHESVQKSLLAPPPANPLDPVRDAAKRRLDGIGGLRHPTFSFRPIINTNAWAQKFSRYVIVIWYSAGLRMPISL